MVKQLASTQESLSIISGWSFMRNPNIHDPVFILTDEVDLFPNVLNLGLQLISGWISLFLVFVFLFNSKIFNGPHMA